VSTNDLSIDASTDTAAGLRRHFDERFAAAAASMAQPPEDFLAIRVGSEPYAFRLSEIAGLHVGVKIVPVPSPEAQLLGIVGIRGMMAPIYDLAAILRYPPLVNARWFVIARAPQPVGFAFEAFESHLQVGPTSLASGNHQNAGTGEAGRHLRGTVRDGGALRPIVHLASMMEMIEDKRS
jgi:chemotaxis signal transduction protein